MPLSELSQILIYRTDTLGFFSTLIFKFKNKISQNNKNQNHNKIKNTYLPKKNKQFIIFKNNF
jgi:hypothetical protein